MLIVKQTSNSFKLQRDVVHRDPSKRCCMDACNGLSLLIPNPVWCLAIVILYKELIWK